MKETAKHTSMSSSQEISVLKQAHKLHRLIAQHGFKLPVQVLAYNCMRNLSPIGMALVGYNIYAVNSDPVDTQKLDSHLNSLGDLLSSDTMTLLQLGEESSQAFDVVLIDGAVLTAVRTDPQLKEICEKISDLIKPNGLLLITPADFDELWKAKKRVLQPHITDDASGRHLHVIVRDWHGNGYEYTESHYIIEDNLGASTVAQYKHQRRAWQCAEITLGLMRAGFEDVEWLNETPKQHIMVARKAT